MYVKRTIAVKLKCTPERMDALRAHLHHAYMNKGSKKPGHFLREWRKWKGLTLEEAAERIEVVGAQRAVADPEARAISMTHATLSRIERGKLPYNQPLLEILAEIYGTEPASLIMRDPSANEPIWSLWDALSPPARQQAFAVIEALKKTGTDG